MQEKIRLGLVGLNFGHHVAGMIMADPTLPVQMTKVCDLDQEKAARAAKEFGVGFSPSLDALLADPEIDAIGLYSGPNGRAQLISKIIRAGKHVMTTKPFENDPQAALDVLYEARKLGKVVHMNSPNARPIGEAAVIHEWIDAGLIGRPTIAQAHVWTNYGPAVPEPQEKPQPAPAAPTSWYDDPLRCPVAPIFRLGIYPLNVLLDVFGQATTVQVMHSRVYTQKLPPDNASMTVGFENGGIINIVGSFVVGGPDKYTNTLTIGGTKGVIYYRTGPVSRDGGPVEIILSTYEQVQRRTLTTGTGMYDWEFFAQRIRGEVAQDVTTPEQIAQAISVIVAMSQAEQTGQMAKVTPI